MKLPAIPASGICLRVRKVGGERVGSWARKLPNPGKVFAQDDEVPFEGDALVQQVHEPLAGLLGP